MRTATAATLQCKKRGKHDKVGAKDHAEAAANPEQAAAPYKADSKGMEVGVKQRQQ
jgi:hypothetical protein